MHHQLIPERDSGPTPKPRIRLHSPSGNRSGVGKFGGENESDDILSLSSVSSVTSGVSNPAYTHDEKDEDPPEKKGPSPPHPKQRGKKYFSSDSENDGLPAQSHIFQADVHTSPKRGTSEKNGNKDSWRIEKENQHPKAKPRRRGGESSDTDVSTDSRRKGDVSPPKSEEPKKDYLAITMPAEKDEPEKDVDESVSESTKHSFVSKWRKAAQTLVSKPSIKKSAKQAKKGMSKPDTKIDIQTLDMETSQESFELTTLSQRKAKKVEEKVVEKKEKKEKKEESKTKMMLMNVEADKKNMYGSPQHPDPPSDVHSSPSKRERRRSEKQGSSSSSEKCMGVTIHSCDLLPMDPNVVHPVVKITILNEGGSVITKHNWSESQKDGDASPKMSKKKGGEDERDTKRRGKSKSKSGLSKANAVPTQKYTSESVLPIMTQPCKLSYYMPTFAPHWNELVLFDEPFNSIVHPDSTAMLFFEVMDFLPVKGVHQSKRFGNYHGNEDGWYKIGWAFLKLIGTNGSRNVNRKLRLQLYKPEPIPTKGADDIEVYHWWKSNRRHKLESTLYVTVKGVVSPTKTAASLRTLLGMRKGDLAQAILESQIQSSKNLKQSDSTVELNRKMGQTDIMIPQWLRLDGQICKMPNKLIKSLPESPIESLNLTISGNVQCVKFSPCGMKLAAGLDTDELHTILLFDIPSGKLASNIRCHHGIIYDLDWKVIEMKNAVVPSIYYLASASADTTATVWAIRNGHKDTPKLVKKLLHPSFVYCVRIHPTKSNLVFTGCFDYVVRIWNVQRTSSKQSSLHDSDTESIPLVLLDKHESFINCMVFNRSGTHVYTGDGSGRVFEWTTQTPSKRKLWKVERELLLRDAGKHPVNSIDLHPQDSRLLVHLRSSTIKVVDLSSFIVLNTLSGVVNEKLQIRSCFSPCGNLVFSGSEDATVCIWDADTGTILHLLSPENHRHCVITCVDYHPHDYYFAIGLASTISEPSPILLYTHRQAKSARVKLQTLSKLATLSKTSTITSSTEQSLPDIPEGYPGFETGDSSEKFIMIVKKLDAALKVSKRPTSSPNPVPSRSYLPPERDTSALTVHGEEKLGLNGNKSHSSNIDTNWGVVRPKSGPPKAERIGDNLATSPVKVSSHTRNNGGNNHSKSSHKMGDLEEEKGLGMNPNNGSNTHVEADKTSHAPEPNITPQVSKVRQKRRQKMKLLYESSDC